MEPITFAATFLAAHWTSLGLVTVAVPALGLALRQRAAMVFFNIALDLIIKVARQELDGLEKRKKVAEQAFMLMPLWAKPFLTRDRLEAVVEVAYQQLKSENKV